MRNIRGHLQTKKKRWQRSRAKKDWQLDANPSATIHLDRQWHKLISHSSHSDIQKYRIDGRHCARCASAIVSQFRTYSIPFSFDLHSANIQTHPQLHVAQMRDDYLILSTENFLRFVSMLYIVCVLVLPMSLFDSCCGVTVGGCNCQTLLSFYSIKSVLCLSERTVSRAHHRYRLLERKHTYRCSYRYSIWYNDVSIPRICIDRTVRRHIKRRQPSKTSKQIQSNK